MARKKKESGIGYLWASIPGLSPEPEKAPSPTKHERQEHAGRVPQVGVPSGPRQTVAPLPGSPAGEAGLTPYQPPAAAPKAKSKDRRGATRQRRAAARQHRLVNEFVNQAYSRKLKRQGVPALDVAARVAKAKDQLQKDREDLLSHPAVKEANAEGKVLGARGLRKVRRADTQLEAIKGPSGLKTTALHGTSPLSLVLSAKDRAKLDRLQGVPQGEVGRGLTLAKQKIHERGEPSTLEVLGYASLGIPIPGVGLGPGAARVAASVIPKLLAEGGARTIAKEAGERAAANVASKGKAVLSIPGRTAAGVKAAPKAARELPSVLRAGAKKAPGALKAGAKAAPRYAGKKAVKGTEHSYQAFGGAAALGAAHRGGLDIPGGALLEGQGMALDHDLPKVLRSTANLAPGLLVSAFQLPVAAGASVATGSTKPLEGAIDEQANFFKHFAETYGSNDPEKIKEATLEEGLLPEILAAPFLAKAGGKLSGPARSRVRDAVESRRAPAMDAEGNILLHEHGGAVKRGRQRSPSEKQQPLTRTGEQNVHRREEAFHAATTNDTIQLEHARRRQEIDRHARKAAGKKTVVREGLGPKGKDTLHQRAPDYLPFLNRAGIDLHNPDAALREIEHYAEKYRDLDHPSKYGSSPEALTARDAVRYFLDHPEALRDKHLASALDEFRAMQNGERGLRSLSTSDRNRYLGHAVMHDIPDAVERVPIGARDHTDETTREGAWKDLSERTKQVKDLRKEGRKKYDQAQEASPERAAKLRAEAKAIYEKARAIEKGRRELHDELKHYTRPGAKANPNAKRIAYDEALEKEMVAETRASLEAKGLHPEPAYVPDTDAVNRATPDQTATGGLKPLPGGAKIFEGFNWRHGLTRQGYEHMMNEAILRQVARNHQFENARRFRADRGIQFEGEFQHTGKDWARAFDQGVMNRRDIALVPTQVVNRLEKATQGGDPTEYEAALAEMQAARKVDPKDAQSGTIYEAYPKAAYDEWVQQAQKTSVPKALRTANRWTSMNMLSTPAFVGAQVAAETAQAIAEVNPIRMIQGLRNYNKLTPDQKLKISGASGETAKAIFSPEELQTTLGSYDAKPFNDALGFFRRNVFGRSAKSFVTLRATGEIDRLKGSYIRRGALTGQIMRDLNGTWAKGRKLLKTQTEIQKRIGHLKPHEQLAWIAEHPKVLDRYQRELHAAMGGWGNLTRTGKVPESARAATLVFYPYLRMSLQWPLKYAKRHPIKATALAYLAAENNFALKEALEGDPSFLNYAQIPVYGVGEDGKPTTINLARIAPGGSALVTAVQGSGSLLGALQPVLAAGIEGATGKGPLGAVEGGVLEHVKAAGAGILGLSPYVRAADTLKGQKDSGQSEYGILGKRANIALNPLAALSSKLKGSKGEQLTRSLVLPFLPQNIDHQRDYAKLGRILTKLGDTGSSAQAKQQATKGTASEQRSVRAKVEAMQKENAKAEGELEKLYAKYGLSKVAARSLDVYKYTHPFPEEEKRGPYEGSGYGGSGYEPSGYSGGGSNEKPVPVPQRSDGVAIPGFNLGGALGAITSPLASIVGGEKASAAQLPKGKARDFLGKKTVGTPDKRELIAAGHAGKLKINHEGKITTPKVRRAHRELERARDTFDKKTVPSIDGFEHQDQKEFAEWFSHYSKLPPKLAGEWVKQEGGGYSNGGEAGEQNWLGIGYPGEKTAMSESSYFNGVSPKVAAKNSALWLEGKIGGEHSYKAADSIVGISRLIKEGAPESTIRAYIEGPSAWGTGAIAQSGIAVRGDKGASPKLKARLQRAERNAKAVGLDPQAEARPRNALSQRKGPYAGSRRFVSEIIGQPVWGDKELGHSAAGDHQPVSAGGSGAAYAQDINQPTNKAKEGEPAYNQQSLDRIVHGLRKMGANVPDLVLGDSTAGNWEGNVNGYRVQIFTNEGGEVSHIHVGARWTGEKPPPGTEFGEAVLSAGSSPASGTVPSVADASATKPQTKGQPRAEGLSGAQRLKLVNEITSGNLEGLGIPGYTPKIGPSVADLAALVAPLEDQRRKLARL